MTVIPERIMFVSRGITVRGFVVHVFNRYRKSVEHNKRCFLLLHKATGFDPTVGSSSGDYIRIKEIKST
jgi:hypothetical protein